jgi:hypothetical protein
MHTLPRAITAQWFPTAAAYQSFRTHWRALLTSDRKRALAAEHHLLYLALAGKDWRKGFTPITNERKLANGAFYGWSLFRALAAIRSPYAEEALVAPFDGLVTPAMLQNLRELMPSVHAYRLRPDDFTATTFPCEAYVVPEPAAGIGQKDDIHA